MVKPDEIVITPELLSMDSSYISETESPDLRQVPTGSGILVTGNLLSAGEYKQYRVGGDLNAEIYIDEFYNNKFYRNLAYFLLHTSAMNLK